MIERFSGLARDAVASSEDHARGVGASRIGSSHLLLGLVEASEGVGARVLGEFAVSSALVQQALRAGQESLDPGRSESYMPFTDELIAVLTRADRESRRREDHQVSTGHVLLALSGEKLSAGHQLLLTLGVDIRRLEFALIERVAEESQAAVDWSTVEKRVEQLPVLSMEEERELAAAVSAGRAAKDALTAGDFEPGRERGLRDVLEAGRQSAGRLIEANDRLCVSISKDFAQEGHRLFYAYQLAREALHLLVWSQWEFDWLSGASFSDYAKPRMIEAMQEALRGENT